MEGTVMLIAGVVLIIIPIAALIVYFMQDLDESWEALKVALKVQMVMLPGLLLFGAGIVLVVWALRGERP